MPSSDPESEPCPPEALIECLYERHHKALLRHALQFTPDPMAAEDACHAVFLRLLERDTLPSNGITLSYLKVAVRHECLNHGRNIRRLTPLSSVQEPMAEVDSPGDDDNRAAFLARSLDHLPRRQRAVMDRWMGGESYQAIS